MDVQKIVAEVRQLIRQGNTKAALAFLVTRVAPQSINFNTLVNIEGRYNQIVREFSGNIIDATEQDLRISQVNNGILSVIGNLAEADIKSNQAGTASHAMSDARMLDMLRESIAEVERLKAENAFLKKERKQQLKIIIRCEPDIGTQANQYKCQCVILDNLTGAIQEKEIPLLREPGGIIATIRNIKPTDYVQIKVSYDNKKWESDYFSPQFLTQTLKMV